MKEHITIGLKWISLFAAAVILYAAATSITQTFPSNNVASANVPRSDIGVKLGGIVHDVVRNIRAQHPDSLITHAHVLALMCQELPSLRIDDTNSEGRQEGYTQVITSTYKGLTSGSMVGGACAYTAGLEAGACADASARTQNARCSIEVGACLYDTLLTQCGGDVACAYNGYNTGSVTRRANGLSDFTQGYANVAKGALCAKAAYNRPVWDAIMETVSTLTGGTFRTDDATPIPVSPNNVQMQNPVMPATLFGQNNSGPGGIISQFLRTTPQNTSPPKTSTVPRTDPVTQRPSLGAATPTPENTSPTLVCVPRTIVPQEEAIILWACGKGYVTADSENLNIDGKLIGATRVSPSETTTYAITCGKGEIQQKARCTIEVEPEFSF